MSDERPADLSSEPKLFAHGIEQDRYQKFLDKAAQRLTELTIALESADRASLATLANGLAMLSDEVGLSPVHKKCLELQEQAQDAEHRRISELIWEITCELSVIRGLLPGGSVSKDK